MKRSLILISIGSAVLLGVGLAMAQQKSAPITGTWDCHAKGGDEGEVDFTLYLEQDGEKVTGSVSSSMGDTEISSGTFKENTLEIHINSPDSEYVLQAKLDKGALTTGTWTKDNTEKGTWEGKKQAAKTN